MMPKLSVLSMLFSVCMLIYFLGCGGNSSSSIHEEIVFDAAFDSGSMEAVQFLSNHRFLVEPRPDYGRDGVVGSSQMEASWDGDTWWYHFSITIPEEHLPYRIELEIDASRVWIEGMYGADKIPVVSCDGSNWRFVDGWQAGIDNPVIYHTITCQTTYVAMATPYPWEQMETFLDSIGTSPFILRKDIIGYTPLGENQDSLPLYYLMLGDPVNQTGKRNIVVTSGQHPGEVVNSWTLTGLIEFLLSNDVLAVSLREEFAFHIYPAVNPEGVKYGHYRRSADSPLNTNRAWDTNEVLEVQIVRDHILIQTQGRADYFFDLHGSKASWYFIYHGANKPGATEWVEALAEHHAYVYTAGGKNTSSYTGSARKWALQFMKSHDNDLEPPLCFVPEGSYAQGSWEGAPHQTDDWKAFGAALLKAICDVEGI